MKQIIKLLIVGSISGVAGYFIGKIRAEKLKDEIHEKEMDELRALYVKSGKYVKKADVKKEEVKEEPISEKRPVENSVKTRPKAEKVDYTQFYESHDENAFPEMLMHHEAITENEYGEEYGYETEAIEVYSDGIYTNGTTGEILTNEEVVEYIGLKTKDLIEEALELEHIDDVWYIRNNKLHIDYNVYIVDEWYYKEE